jgi:hypothetical protein
MVGSGEKAITKTFAKQERGLPSYKMKRPEQIACAGRRLFDREGSA